MFISASDTHLSETIYVGLPQMRGDSYRSLDQICAHTVASKASALILAGDVFDSQPSPLDVECFLHNLSTLKQARIKVYAIQGQHGHDEKLPWTSIDRYVIDLDHKVFELEPGVFCAGFDTLPPDELQHELAKLDPKANLLVLHQMAKGIFGQEKDGEQAWNFDPQWVPDTVKLVLLGDYHNKCQLSRYAVGKAPMYYHGSTCMQSIDETPEKVFFEVRYQAPMPLIGPNPADNSFLVKTVPLQTRPYHNFLVMSDDTYSAARSGIEKAEPDSLVHVKYDPRIGAVEEGCRKANDRCHFLFRLLPIKDVCEVSIENLKGISLETCLAAAVDPQQDPEFYGFVLSLLKSKKPKETLEALKAKYLEVKHDPAVTTQA